MYKNKSITNLFIDTKMTKIKEEGTAPKISKYAAKKAARIAAANAEVKNNTESVSDSTNEFDDKPVEELDNKSSKAKTGTVVGKDNRQLSINVPEHVLEIAYIVKDNAAIRRHCSLNILNYLTQTKRIPADAGGKFVKFLWNKFRVSANGLTSEFSYKEQFFLDALVASFGQFAKDAENTISVFVDKECKQ